ncbi:ROK family protein [Pelagicoccus albus]|uniref:ROK family protein n=1 Tax=Pelagicoccus albus TaxID=415222 RepID=A0A7X1B8H9_9BACT|nr:ROK family protein [Pelagicoccus albus]MBC2607517.1 ROK family protein [Pelagicoccus albus]
MKNVFLSNGLRDERVVLTLDGGGTSFRFSAMQNYTQIVDTVRTPSFGDDLDRCLANVIEGFEQVKALCPEEPSAISFAFPGPAPYANGIIGDLANMPAFRGGVALGPMLEDHFRIPVYIHNDGDMFAYGESIAGLLPWVNDQLAHAGVEKRFKNLLGVTLGTGFGSGLVSEGRLLIGDNSMAGEIWLMRNKRNPNTFAEEGASIRAIRRVYAAEVGIPEDEAPEPKVIADIAEGLVAGNRGAAIEAFRAMGEVVGDAIANAITVFDALVVVGGGLSGAGKYFLPTLVDELNSAYQTSSGEAQRRLTQLAFNLESEEGIGQFIGDDIKQIKVPRSNRTVPYGERRFTGVGLSRLETSRAIAIGAYSFALQKLDAVEKIRTRA